MLSNRQLLLPYALPYLAFVAIASLFGDIFSKEVNYALRIIALTALLLWARRWYCSLTGPKSPWVSTLVGTAVGLFGTAVWIVLLNPFVDSETNSDWSASAFMLRLIAAGLFVPLFEELMMRGYILRLALQWDQERKRGNPDALQTALDERSINDVKPGAWSWWAVVLSTLAFTAGHAVVEWPATVVYGLLMAGLWVYRQDLLSCIVAHSVTNIALALYVLHSGRWYLW